MMRNVWFFLCIAAVLLTACGEKPTPEAAAMASAQQYYEQLMDGDYEAFVMGQADAERYPESFRQQLITATKQFVAQLDQRGGICSITSSRALMDSTLQLMQVYMLISYADSTQEEIVVPMVERDGEWKMK